MKRALQLLILLVVTSVLILPVEAQDTPTITSGQTVTYEISNQNYEFHYQFVGKKDDTVILYTQPSKFAGQLTTPVLRLLDSHRNVLVDSKDGFAPYGATIALELPENETYTVIATRKNGATGTDSGEFILYYSRLTELAVNQPITEKLVMGSHDNYYVIHQTDHPLTLTYHKLDGDAYPDIDVNSLSGGNLLSEINLGGYSLTQGEITLPTDIDPIIISIGGFVSHLNLVAGKISYQLTVS